MNPEEFLLPDVGEGLTEAEIVEWKVAPGDTVTVNQVLVEIETAKSLVELPSPFAGVVDKLLVAAGTTVEVGTPIISVSAVGGLAPVEPVSPRVEEGETETVADTTASIGAEDKPGTEETTGAVLVGYGLKGHVSSRR